MSEANVDLVRRGFESLREGDFETLLPLIHPEFEATTPAALAAEPDTYRGHDGVRRYFESFYEAMDRVGFQAQELIPVGDLIVVDTVLRTRGRTTGIATEQRLATVWELKDGKAYRLSVYATVDEAVAAA